MKITLTVQEFGAMVILLPLAFMLLGLALGAFLPKPAQKGWAAVVLASMFTVLAFAYMRVVGGGWS